MNILTLSSILIAGLLLASPCALAEPVVIRDIRKASDHLTLYWAGGQPPFLIQDSANLQNWNDVGTTASSTFRFDVSGQAHGFFRVRGSSQPPDLGEHYGQWRISQGEFDGPLAKHRLKSLWDFFLPQGQTPRTARALFTTANVRIRYWNGGQIETFTGRLQDLPRAVLRTDDREIALTWTWGQGVWERDLTLTMTFRYPVDAIRFSQINLSDPTVRIRANYRHPKPRLDTSGGIAMTTSEEAFLAEIDDSAQAAVSRPMRFTHAGATIDSSYDIGVPLLRGNRPFIFKTLLLVKWNGTTISGLSSRPIELNSRFSQTYFPAHHNFDETLWLEPAIEPGMDPSILEELRRENIRFIVAGKSIFPGTAPRLGVLGFDDTFRNL